MLSVAATVTCWMHQVVKQKFSRENSRVWKNWSIAFPTPTSVLDFISQISGFGRGWVHFVFLTGTKKLSTEIKLNRWRRSSPASPHTAVGALECGAFCGSHWTTISKLLTLLLWCCLAWSGAKRCHRTFQGSFQEEDNGLWFPSCFVFE